MMDGSCASMQVHQMSCCCSFLQYFAVHRIHTSAVSVLGNFRPALFLANSLHWVQYVFVSAIRGMVVCYMCENFYIYLWLFYIQKFEL